MRRFLISCFAAVALCAFATVTATVPAFGQSESATTFAPASASASASTEGEEQEEEFLVRLVTVEVNPEDAGQWESGVRHLVAAARAAGDAFWDDWLCYREGRDRYWIVFFGDGLADLVTPASFAEAFVGTEGEEEFREGVRLMQSSRYEVVGDDVVAAVGDWGTLEEMSTTTHPAARLTKYWVRPGAEAAFSAAMRDYANVLGEGNYPYPVDGFEWRIGSPLVNYINVFCDDWDAFEGINEMRLVMLRNGKEVAFDAVQARIEVSVQRIEHHYIDLDAELTP